MASKLKRRKAHEQERNDRKLKRHLRALGLKSEEEYQAWCINRGLGKGLRKSTNQRQKEREIAKRSQADARLTQKRRHTRHPRNTIALLYRSELGKEKLGADYLKMIRTLFKKIGDQTRVRRAFYDLLIQVERYGSLFGADPAIPYLGPVPGNTFIEGLGMLARQREVWIRPIADWRPNSHNPRRQFNHLARYLFATYDVPFFIDAAWFQEDEAVAQKQQGWFRHIGDGQNIRTADIPVKLSKMMGHCFSMAPEGLPIERALRWGQVVGQGGSESLARAVMSSRLGMHFEHEDFWETVIKFLVNHPMLDPALVGPITDFVHNQKYEPREIVRPGGAVELAGPPQPNFAVKGRSIDKLMRLMEEWHEDLGQELPVDDNGTFGRGRKALVKWEPSGIGSLRILEEDPQTGERITWMIQELLSNRELIAEGRAMHHCVASYGKNCRKGNTSIWSLQAVDGNQERQAVMTIAVDARSKNVTQVRGRYNMAPVGKAKDSKQRSLNRAYKRLLARSQRVFQRWMSQEGLKLRC